MPITQTREITAAKRLENVRYAIRDLACVAENYHVRESLKITPLDFRRKERHAITNASTRIDVSSP